MVLFPTGESIAGDSQIFEHSVVFVSTGKSIAVTVGREQGQVAGDSQRFEHSVVLVPTGVLIAVTGGRWQVAGAWGRGQVAGDSQIFYHSVVLVPTLESIAVTGGRWQGAGGRWQVTVKYLNTRWFSFLQESRLQ